MAMAPTPVLSPENPMDGEAWWAAVHGVAGSRTRLSNPPTSAMSKLLVIPTGSHWCLVGDASLLLSKETSWPKGSITLCGPPGGMPVGVCCLPLGKRTQAAFLVPGWRVAARASCFQHHCFCSLHSFPWGRQDPGSVTASSLTFVL